MAEKAYAIFVDTLFILTAIVGSFTLANTIVKIVEHQTSSYFGMTPIIFIGMFFLLMISRRLEYKVRGIAKFARNYKEGE